MGIIKEENLLVVDSNSGQTLHEGETFKNVHGLLKVVSITKNPPRIVLEVLEPNTMMLEVGLYGLREIPNPHAFAKGQILESELIVRFDHPSFPDLVVGFVPS